MNELKINKYIFFIAVLAVTLMVVTATAVSAYSSKKQLEAKQWERDVRASFSLMMTIDKELRRYQSMYYRGEIDEESLREHQSMMRGLCNTAMRIRHISSMDYIRFICPEGMDEVNDEAAERYSAMSDYLMIVYEEASVKGQENQESDALWLNSLYDAFTSEAFETEIKRIVGSR